MIKKQELRLEEIERRYVGEWVLVEETAWDEQGNPTKGVVFAHGLDREAIVGPTSRLHLQKPGVKTFVFYAGPKVPEGLVVVL
jgi:hypothetical protein